MRHKKSKSLNNRFTSWKKATLISLAKSLLIHQTIVTTRSKASSAQPLVEKLISLAKDNSLAAQRRAYSVLGEHRLVSLLFKEIGPRFQGRSGGYTRIFNLGSRRGDNARQVIFELTEIKKKEGKKPRKAKTQEAKPAEESAAQPQAPLEEKKTKTEVMPKEERPPISKKPAKKFLGGLRKIFKKERDSL
ncbi:MAG: 50S ribosomal protein L17 [Candidatus Omnitrophica bacterium]|nr:50S ribosomal protein L17 [Candidatus Omnitrophota bacterium]